jgi:hypothetical protein
VLPYTVFVPKHIVLDDEFDRINSKHKDQRTKPNDIVIYTVISVVCIDSSSKRIAYMPKPNEVFSTEITETLVFV